MNITRLHRIAVLQALLVTFLWSTSFVLVKIGLNEIPALTFAGLRYSLAFLCLIPISLRAAARSGFQRLNRQDWLQLIILGLLFYAVTQGSIFLSLKYLSAATISLMLNVSTILVALFGIIFLGEKPSPLQWLGVLLFITGAAVYFLPVDIRKDEAVGLIIVTAAVLANSISTVLGRNINRKQTIEPVLITTISMGIGASTLIALGLPIQGIPTLKPIHWIIIAWLAVVNTAFAFTLWNRTQRELTAVESSIINNTMLIQTAILAWVFLAESLDGQEIIGLVFAAVGALIVQLKP